MFYGVDPFGKEPKSCGGDKVNLSLLSGPYYKTCEASSSFPNKEYECEGAFNGKMLDAPFDMWASDGEGVAAWIKIEFKQSV